MSGRASRNRTKMEKACGMTSAVQGLRKCTSSRQEYLRNVCLGAARQRNQRARTMKHSLAKATTAYQAGGQHSLEQLRSHIAWARKRSSYQFADISDCHGAGRCIENAEASPRSRSSNYRRVGPVHAPQWRKISDGGTKVCKARQIRRVCKGSTLIDQL